MDGLEKTIIESIDQSDLRMTDLGLSVSQMVRDQIQTVSDDEEEYLESALKMGRKRKTGVRGRPKEVDHGFGRSTTHKLPPEAARLMGTANLAYVSRDYDRAIDLLLQVIKLSPNSFEPYHTLGLIWEERGEKEKAGGFYMLSALLNPGNSELWLKLADWAELEDGGDSKRSEAVLCLSKAIKALMGVEEVDYTLVEELFWRRARLHLALGQPKEAIRSFLKLLISRPDDIGLVKRLAKLAIAQNIPVSAADVLERAGRKVDKDKMTWSLINLILELLFMAEDQIDYARIAKICSEYASILSDQSLLLSLPEWGTWSEEKREEKMLLQVPLEIYIKYAVAIVKSGSCSIDIDKILSCDSEEFGDLLTLLADALLASAFYSQAATIFEKLQSCEATWSARGCCALGHCYQQLGQIENAINSFKACLTADPGYEEARIALGCLYRDTGNEQGLLETLESGRRFKATQKKTKRKGDDLIDKEDEVWSESESEYEMEEEDRKHLLISSKPRKSSRQARSRAPSSKIEFPDVECNKNKQEYTRVILALEVGISRRELYSDALLAAHQLIQDGLLCNPNVMMTSNKRAKWMLSVDWAIERSVLKGLLVSEWINLIIKYCTSVSEYFGQAAQACNILLRLHNESMLFKLCSELDAVKLRISLAECALLVKNYQLILLATRPFIKDMAANGTFLKWFWGRMIPDGQSGRDCLLSSTPFTRFLGRHVQHLPLNSPARDNLLCLQGHLYALSGSWEEALRTYLLINTNDDMKRMFLFNAYYHRAQQRTCTCQKWFFMKALACLDGLQGGDEGSRARIDYNRARCFHGLGLLDGASRYYLRAMEHSDPGLKWAATYNLSLVAKKAGIQPSAAVLKLSNL